MTTTFTQLFGKPVRGEKTPIQKIMTQHDNMYDVIVEGVISDIDIKTFSNKKNPKLVNRLYTGSIYDGTSSMFFKFFNEGDYKLEDKQILRMKGKVEYDDRYKHELVFDGMDVMQAPAEDHVAPDEAPVKRGELAFLSKMSRHRSTLSVEDGIKRALAMGHSYLALTDIEVAQAYPDAYNTSKKLENFKLIYGLTMNMVDDEHPIVFNPTTERIDNVTYTVLDKETTGLSTEDDDIIEIGATKFAPYIGFQCHTCLEVFPNKSTGDEQKNSVIKEGICPSCLGKKKKGITSAMYAEALAAKRNMDENNDEKQVKKLEKAFSDIAAVTLERITHKAVGRFRKIVYSKKPITPFITELTGHSQEVVDAGEPFEQSIIEFEEFWKGTVLVAHNAPFDKDMLTMAYKRLGREQPAAMWLDTLQLARVHRTDIGRHGLGYLTKAYNVVLEQHHRADLDAQATGEILVKMIVELLDKGIHTFQDINNMRNETYFSTMFPKRIRLWVQTQEGLKNLYKLISESHTTYLHRGSPIIPKRIVEENRKGILVGSAGLDGALFEVALNKSPEQVKKDASWYDVIEIQPSEMAEHFPRQGRCENMESIDRAWKTIYTVGKDLGKQLIATGEVQYAVKKDRTPHHMLLYKEKAGLSHERSPGKLDDMEGYAHFRYTNEMLQAFPWLSQNEVQQIVIENPAKLADTCESIEIIPKELYTPKIEGANEELEEMTYNRARELYGEDLPEYVQARITKELKSILGYGFAVIYLISQKLVKKSVDAGYLVGSRGSVGSSFVATMTGITEVNPLKPHYHCTNCQWAVFFDHEDVQSGYDLPRSFQPLLTEGTYSAEGVAHFTSVLEEKLGKMKVEQLKTTHQQDVCPHCEQEALKRDGQDIPFETFLGFKGDKVPDIDLNFSGEYQGITHRYVEELFGAKFVYRAGTVGTVADNTAYGYVKAYVEGHKEYYQEQINQLKERYKQAENDEQKAECAQTIRELEKSIKELSWSNAESGRIANIIKGSRRTSGQHPGGMLVVPDYKDIHDFTPYQYPANSRYDKDTGEEQQQTSHFDFHAIHDNILKLDILGHDDPTELHILQELTGIDPKTLPANDEKVMKLFTKPEEAGIPINRIEAKTGTLGIPEFGTEFVQEMILDTQPTTFAELVKISGLSHGTDVWLGNAQELIRNGICSLKDVIDTRDNIMVALVQKELEESLAFTIMESVRKGKGLTPEMELEMRKKHVEEWYIDSCKKIKYMFPKAHASAYVLSAVRIAYYKVNHAIEFYAAHLSVRSCEESILEIVKDSDTIRARIRELASIIQVKKSARPKQSFAKEKNLKDALDLVLEAKERGIKFAPPRMYGSHATQYILEGDTLIAPFSSVPGIGTKAAISFYQEAQKGIFRGVEDLKKRTGASKTVIEVLRQLGCLELIEELQHTLY